MQAFNLVTALLGALVMVLGLASRWLARSALPPSLLALLVGVLAGPHALDLIDVGLLTEEPILREKFARLALGIALVGVALRIPKTFPRRGWRSTLMLVGVGMPLTWAISTVLVWIFLDLPFWLAAVIGGAVTPTDPVAATPIVTGDLAEKHLPERLRHTISLESGVNDGGAYLLVFLGFLMLTRPVESALSHLLVRTFLWEIVAGAALGFFVGYGAGRLLEWAEARNGIEGDWRLIYSVALALFAIGAGRLIGSDEVLVAFVAGVAFTQVITREDRQEEDHGQEAVNRFFVVGVFALIGLTIPWDGWLALGWRGFALAGALLVLRRLPVLMLLEPLLPDVRGSREARFAGWFGAIAVAALYYASLMEDRLGEPVIWHVVSLVICTSAVAHGTTGAAFTRRMSLHGGPDPRS